MDAKLLLEEYQDYLAPKLDTYEQAIYLYLLRHSRLQGKDEIVVGFKSARLRMAFGLGIKSARMGENTCYEKLRSLASKGCVDIVRTERDGTRVRLKLPAEIDGIMPLSQAMAHVTLEDMDFFNVAENRLAILRREANRCFYCLRVLDASNYVIEHVTSRPEGNNSYRNVVAACWNCNNRKGPSPVEDFLRVLYREGYLEASDFEQRCVALRRLKNGELQPIMAGGSV
jgi:hypothetical protein